MSETVDALISVLIIEDHPIFREALREHLETRPDRFRLVGDVGGVAEGVQLVKDQVPDIVLLDLGLPERTDDGIEEGLEAIQAIRAISPNTQIVILTGYRKMSVVFRAIQAGAVSYLLKDHVSGGEVINSLLQVQAGNPPIDPEVARQLWDFFQNPDMLDYDPQDALTARELEILHLIAGRQNNEQIAKILVISPATVKKHVSNILSKLHLHNRLELMAFYRTNYAQFKAKNSPPPAAPGLT